MAVEARPAPGAAGRPHLHVACAIIEREGLILAAQRSATMSLPLKWEFPGGKIQGGESAEQCLHRELREELGIGVGIREALPASTHAYPSFTITLYPLRCAIASGTPVLHEHAAVAWVAPQELGSLDWAEADLPVIGAYLAGRARARASLTAAKKGPE
jgi:8-oxo-dGTP diphosphatase